MGVVLQTVPWDAEPTSCLRLVMVHPELRRRGIARALLDRAASSASDEGRVRPQWQMPDGRPATMAFAAAQGAKRLGIFEQNRVATSALDRSTLETRGESARDAARGYELIGLDDHARTDIRRPSRPCRYSWTTLRAIAPKTRSPGLSTGSDKRNLVLREAMG